jgi:hypothetical protein
VAVLAFDGVVLEISPLLATFLGWSAILREIVNMRFGFADAEGESPLSILALRRPGLSRHCGTLTRSSCLALIRSIVACLRN